jgi:dUTP pyrophosphatase
MHKLRKEGAKAGVTEPLTLQELAALTKCTGAKPTLVPTGLKCKLEANQYLELSVRSSCPLKYWLVLANSVGIIDSDYYNNSDNEGHIYFQIINFSPFSIQLKKGDIIGQGIIKEYMTTANDCATGLRNGGFGSTSQEASVTAI